MKYGLIGEKLSHSYSKTIHNLFGNNEYKICEIPPENIKKFINSADFYGINVTIPYKKDVIPYCILSENAQQIGSVNTIINKNGKLYGHNTDYFGFLYMSKKTNISFYGKKVLILGSGGTSKTVSCVVQESNAKEIVIVSRNGENNYQNIEKHYDSDIIINTTPVGMYPNNDGIPVDIAHFLHLNGVIDVIYNPIKTNLLLAAQRKNINYINGLSMLVAQAWFSHKLFFDIDCNDTEDIEVIENILQKIEKMFRNIVLIGMPGCGKTTIGKALAERLGVKFVDTDSKIETIIGKSPAELIETNGEEYFRKIESEIILKTAKETGQVIATGGGSVLLPQNRDALMQNGFIIYLDREIEKLATDNRPLSKNIDALYKERAPVYNALCSIKINVNDNLEDNIKRITELLK